MPMTEPQRALAAQVTTAFQALYTQARAGSGEGHALSNWLDELDDLSILPAWAGQLADEGRAAVVDLMHRAPTRQARDLALMYLQV